MAGIYIHIPFCKKACNYCNFHFSTSLKQKDELIIALCKEILMPVLHPLSPIPLEEIDEKFDKEVIKTLYFGGGTPSILEVDDLKLIFGALHKRYVFDEDVEITLEANPDDITDTKLQEWKNFGINRFSVGIQSFIDSELVWMNRAHTAAESLICIDKIKAAGFANFSVDLIYGSPLLSNDNWKKNVQKVIEKKIPHISCYALTVEPNTALYKMISLNKKVPIDTEKQANQFLLLMAWMNAAGYEHYEISNFAIPGQRSIHNSNYWSGEKYYGFGPSAHSYFPATINIPAKRSWNIANNSSYIQSLQKNIIPYQEELLSNTQQLNEYIMTALRTMEGIDLKFVKNNFGQDKINLIKKSITKYELSKKLQIQNDKIILTNAGKLFADGITADLFFTD